MQRKEKGCSARERETISLDKGLAKQRFFKEGVSRKLTK